MSKNIYSKKKKNSGFWMIYLVSFLFLLLLSFVLATIWQRSEDNANSLVSTASSAESGSESQPELSSEASSPSESESETQSSEIDYGSFTLVPELDRVTSEYFDNAVFIGDSITEGIKTYGMMTNSTVIAATGINISTISSKAVIKTASGRITVLDALKQHSDTGKIYVLLGGNGIAWMEKDSFIQMYGDFIKSVRELCPNALIYIQSIFPINEEKFAKHYDSEITNAKINEYNDALLKLAEELDVYYLNVAETISGQDGALSEDATTDGMHIGADYYEKWFNYLKKHAVPAA